MKLAIQVIAANIIPLALLYVAVHMMDTGKPYYGWLIVGAILTGVTLGTKDKKE